MHWTARGYAVVNVDIPGTWHSGGNATYLSPEEAASGYDLVEWAAAQPWSSGKAGMTGVSYLASAQWSIAAANPPHLAAINPWEGWSDTYREVARHGGIPETYFWPYIGQRWGYGTNLVEDLAAEMRYEVRERAFTGTRKSAADWPLPGTEYERLFLDAGSALLRREAPAAAESVAYDSEQAGRGRGRATFDLRFDATTELVGNARLRVWMSAPEADDMDVFVALQKLDSYGDLVGFPFYAVFTDGPVALGWIRASHRELDEQRSTPWQPVLAHRRERKPGRGQVVPLDIEILPSGTRFGPGETLRLVIQGRDIYRQPRPLVQAFHDDSVNQGAHVIHTGGRFDSHLLIPRAPG